MTFPVLGEGVSNGPPLSSVPAMAPGWEAQHVGGAQRFTIYDAVDLRRMDLHWVYLDALLGISSLKGAWNLDRRSAALP